MLSPEVIKKIRKIHIRSGHIVNTMMAGQYRSVFRGQGIEFEEVREYTPGDEVKSIDWKVSARLGKPYVKRYREERELILMLLVDMSASAQFGTEEDLKMEIAAQVASILAFNAIRNNDKVGAILFTSRVEKYIPPKKGASHVWRVIKEIFTFRPEQKGTSILSAVQYLGKVERKRTISFLISDFIANDPEDALLRQLRMVSRKHELTGLVLSDPKEGKLPEGGLVHIRDMETGDTLVLDAADRKTRKWYAQKRENQYQGILRLLKSADMDAVEISTKDSPADVLVRYFRKRERRMR